MHAPRHRHRPRPGHGSAWSRLGFGGSLISIFARLGGGIFTKGADVGADLVGKVEAGIPEDDPRNPAVIADNVGDNVGDCAGMAADLFETYAVTIVATMLLGNIFFAGDMKDTDADAAAADRRRVHRHLGGRHLLRQARHLQATSWARSTRACSPPALFSVVAIAIVIGILARLHHADRHGRRRRHASPAASLFLCALIGLAVTGLMVWITEYYTATDYRPVRSIAQASTTGHGTNVIQGLAVSMEATALPVLVICVGIILAYLAAGLYGIAIAATTMLSLAGMIVALDAYGPVTDNAGGIAEMADLPPDVRKVTDALDAVGNTTKAVTKGYAIGSAGLASLVLFAAYTQDLHALLPERARRLRAAQPVRGRRPVHRRPAALPVRRDGHDRGRPRRRLGGGRSPPPVPGNPRHHGRHGEAGLRPRRRHADQGGDQGDDRRRRCCRCWRRSCSTSWSAAIAGQGAAFTALGAMLLGTIVTGLFVAISMTSGGGAWDNAKKYIEEGNHGGKGSDAHKAAVTGDTVGDPYKDTAGPAVNPMIKITNIVALLLLAVLAAMLH